MYSEEKDFDETKFTKDLNKKRLSYHAFLISTIFFIFLSVIVYMYGKENDAEFIYKVCCPILLAISGITSVLAIKAEIKYNEAKNFCHCQKSNNGKYK